MRNTLLSFALLLVPLAVAAFAGCSQSSDAAFPTEAAGGADPRIPNEGDVTLSVTDAGAPSAEKVVRGSPLCKVTPGRCMPDDDGIRASYGEACAEPQSDGGAPEGDASPATSGCRIQNESGAAAPHCWTDGGADRRGVDGAFCATGAECAPGFDCVEGLKGAVCRRYCCSGSCGAFAAQNGGPTFCDVQSLVDARLKAPVCMPLKKCRLLAPNECSEDETCAVVTEKGEAGCVARGTADEGAPCDDDHCLPKLTCLGTVGDRRCYRLCKTDGTDCKTSQRCITGAVFQDTTFGVCQ